MPGSSQLRFRGGPSSAENIEVLTNGHNHVREPELTKDEGIEEVFGLKLQNLPDRALRVSIYQQSLDTPVCNAPGQRCGRRRLPHAAALVSNHELDHAAMASGRVLSRRRLASNTSCSVHIRQLFEPRPGSGIRPSAR